MLATNPRPRYRRPRQCRRAGEGDRERGRRLAASAHPAAFTPLHCAAQAGSVEVIELLLHGWRGTARLRGPLGVARRRSHAARVVAHAYAAASRATATARAAPRTRFARLCGRAGGRHGGHRLGATLTRRTCSHGSLPSRAARTRTTPDALTPLHMAAAFDMPDVVTALIEMGAHLEPQNPHGRDPAGLRCPPCRPGDGVASTAGRSRHAGVAPGTCIPLHEACAAGNAPAAGALIDAGADVNARVEVSARGKVGARRATTGGPESLIGVVACPARSRPCHGSHECAYVAATRYSRGPCAPPLQLGRARRCPCSEELLNLHRLDQGGIAAGSTHNRLEDGLPLPCPDQVTGH